MRCIPSILVMLFIGATGVSTRTTPSYYDNSYATVVYKRTTPSYYDNSYDYEYYDDYYETGCGSLPSIPDGSLSLDSEKSTYGSTASVSCKTGYDADKATITCELSGVWETATCTIKDCGSLPIILDGLVSLNSPTSTHGSTASVSCNTGYDANKASITYQSTGIWETATCTIKDCGSLPTPANGSVSLDSKTRTYGSTAAVSCDTGYGANKASVTCQSTGVWETATCTIRDCGSLPFILHGSSSLNSATSTYGSTASVSCNTGYDANKTSITCQSTGIWETATCTIKDCGALPLVNGTLSLDSASSTYRSTATVACNKGYKSDSTSISCLSTGAWELPSKCYKQLDPNKQGSTVTTKEPRPEDMEPKKNTTTMNSDVTEGGSEQQLPNVLVISASLAAMVCLSL